MPHSHHQGPHLSPMFPTVLYGNAYTALSRPEALLSLSFMTSLFSPTLIVLASLEQVYFLIFL